ncbi:hypothetical protein C8J56DRAFT_1076195 [Mycena floridula]|nr:hypothetical protein C8J56DRAFT_1076195 [Mycena floridula]
MDALNIKAAKKRKVIDKSFPNVPSRTPNSPKSRKCTKPRWTMTGKTVEIQDALARIHTTTRTLRIFLSHTVSGQLWQVGVEGAEMTSIIEMGTNSPAWVFEVAGRLLETSRGQYHRVLLSGRGLECRIQPWTGSRCDELEIRPRKYGLLYLEHFPEQYKIYPDLGASLLPVSLLLLTPLVGDILGFKEDSRLGVI